jgi:hypothetical protein
VGVRGWQQAAVGDDIYLRRFDAETGRCAAGYCGQEIIDGKPPARVPVAAARVRLILPPEPKKPRARKPGPSRRVRLTL